MRIRYLPGGQLRCWVPAMRARNAVPVCRAGIRPVNQSRSVAMRSMSPVRDTEEHPSELNERTIQELMEMGAPLIVFLCLGLSKSNNTQKERSNTANSPVRYYYIVYKGNSTYFAGLNGLLCRYYCVSVHVCCTTGYACLECCKCCPSPTYHISIE